MGNSSRGIFIARFFLANDYLFSEFLRAIGYNSWYVSRDSRLLNLRCCAAFLRLAIGKSWAELRIKPSLLLCPLNLDDESSVELLRLFISLRGISFFWRFILAIFYSWSLFFDTYSESLKLIVSRGAHGTLYIKSSSSMSFAFFC